MAIFQQPLSGDSPPRACPPSAGNCRVERCPPGAGTSGAGIRGAANRLGEFSFVT